MRPRNKTVILPQSQQDVIDPADPRGALDDGVEDRCTSVGDRLMMPSTSDVAV
jgi:hypothetical protein